MVKLNFVGDVALFKEFEILQGDPFKSIELPDADLNIANFEFPVPQNINKNYYDVSDNYRVNFSYAKKLSFNSFSIQSVANNHIQDYGIEGTTSTVKLLES
jgi:hypothetical protein